MDVKNQIKQNKLVIIPNREDPDQTASSEAVWSGSGLFVKAYLGQLVFEILKHLPYVIQ